MIDFVNYDSEHLEAVEPNELSEMFYSERKFLNGIIRYLKPKKLLEVGVARGGSAAVILNAIKDVEDAKLYSLDLFTYYGGNTTNIKTGCVIDELVPELKSKHELITGDYAFAFMEHVGKDIDFMLLDTMHVRPGEILDFLMVFPYLKDDAWLVIHDVAFQQYYDDGDICALLFSALCGEKIIPSETEYAHLPNIGLVKLNKDNKANIINLFCLLNLQWQFGIKPEDLARMRAHYAKHYDEKCLAYFDLAVAFNLDFLNGKTVLAYKEQKKQQCLNQRINDLELENKSLLQENKNLLQEQKDATTKEREYLLKKKQIEHDLFRKNLSILQIIKAFCGCPIYVYKTYRQLKYKTRL